MSKKSKPAKPLSYDCSFADIIAPITEEEFFRDYFGKKHLHIPGAANKYEKAMTWEILSNLLNMHSIWSSSSLMLAVDRKVIPANEYCRPGIDHSGNNVMQPDPNMVKQHISNGATLVCNDIDTLNPGLMGICNALEKAVNGKSQANLYCSSKQRQAFGSHYDTHDVFAMHMEGEKVWRIFSKMENLPIRHPEYIKPDERQQKERGDSYIEITMKPGDFLYVPRGLYHDALSSSDGCIHIAFGLTGYIGLDVIETLGSAMVHDPLFRLNAPRLSLGRDAMKKHLSEMADHIGKMLQSDKFIDATIQRIEDFHYERSSYELPLKAKKIRFKITSPDFSITMAQGKIALVNSQKQGVPIPPNLVDQIKWVISKSEFERTEFTEKFSESGIDALDQTLQNLQNMRVIQQV
ncbi:cupin domain-containing protein [Curvivirga sp.]|uniref:cupin domain-containing protein n=1 Tax=Curvivirga sp. TaxID=2856848 RepID=UPI003B591A9E